MELHNLTITEIRNGYLQKKFSVSEVVGHFLKRLEQINPKLNAYVSPNENLTLETQNLDKKLMTTGNRADLPILFGVPFGVKEIFCTKNIKTTAASKILENFVPPYDATVVTRLKEADGFILGKLNQDEFAMGSSNENSIFGSVKNPWNLECTPGGSSGGSAAAQAARLCTFSLGTDTGGSIRQPASFCGVFGIKPTYGRVSRYGMIAFASSLDQAGPLTNCVEDAAITLQVMAGADENDQTCSQKIVPKYFENLKPDVSNKTIGVVKEFFTSGSLDPDVQKSVDMTIEALKKAGARFKEVSISLSEMAIPIYYLIACSEASSNLSRYDGVKFGYRKKFASLAHVSLDDFYSESRGEAFGSEVKRRILLGTYCLSAGYYDAYYKKACQVRRLLLGQYQKAFESCDLLLSPVTTSPAFKLGEKISDPLSMYLNDIFTVSANLAGLPAASVPVGFSKQNLPIGVQLMAPHFEEQRLLDTSLFLQTVFEANKKMPSGIG